MRSTIQRTSDAVHWFAMVLTKNSAMPIKSGLSLLVVVAVLSGMAGFVRAQAPMADSPAIEARAQALVDKMTVEEKLAYIGGTGFAARAVPRLNIPALEMSDGPYGTRSNAGAAFDDVRSRYRTCSFVGPGAGGKGRRGESARMRGRGALCTCWGRG